MAFDLAAKTRFLANPRAFIGSITLMIAEECYRPNLKGHADELTFESYQGPPGRKATAIGSDGQITYQNLENYILVKRKSEAVFFKGYLIKYAEGKTPSPTLLGDEADVCFTATMNGCTLGIGSQVQGIPACYVTHSNVRGQGSQDANTAMQRHEASNKVGIGGHLFEPEHYRGDGSLNSITFGYRESGLWKFAYLPFSRSGGIITTYGVREVTTNTITQDFLKQT